MAQSDSLIYETTTKLAHYKVVERIYAGRQSRLLYDGLSDTAQSGIPLDGQDLMLFGYNQRLVELVAQLKPQNVLVIGGGVYTLPSYLSAKYPSMRIDVVEPDKDLDDIAWQYFNFRPSANLQAIHDYGLHFLKTTKKTYDLIIVDAYSEFDIPAEILTKRFAKHASNSIKAGGLVAINVISNLAADSPLSKVHASYSKYFSFSKIFPAEPESANFYPSNLVYVASAKSFNVNLKYPPLSWTVFSS